MKIPSLLEMLQAGMHFGHQVSRWHPKMKPYIYADRNGVHIIDLEKTQEKLEETLAAVKKMVAEGKVIMFVTTKPQAKEIVKQAAIDCDMPYLVERWLGGMLTNYSEMKKLIRRYIDWKDKQATGEFERYSKKERLEIQKQLDKMDTTLVGLTKLERMPDALFIPALQREKTAMLEAQRMNVPIIAVCDTNSNPDLAEHFIPANDDAVNSIRMISGLISAAIKEGREEFKRKNTENVSRQSK